MERYTLFLFNDADFDDVEIYHFDDLDKIQRMLLAILEDMKEDEYCFYSKGHWKYNILDYSYKSWSSGSLRSLLNV